MTQQKNPGGHGKQAGGSQHDKGDMTVREAAALMSPGHTQTALPIVDGQRLAGIVTVSDLLNLAASVR